MVDVAQHAGVSIKTVSRVINNAPHVQQDLGDRSWPTTTVLSTRLVQRGLRH
jgi:hypothetical protein